MRDATFEDIQNILHECKALANDSAAVCYSTDMGRWLAYISLKDFRETGDTPLEAVMNLKSKLEAVAYREKHHADMLSRTLGLEAAE